MYNDENEIQELVELSDSDTWEELINDDTDNISNTESTVIQKLKSSALIILIVLLISIIIFNQTYCIAIVNGQSMKPTYNENQIVLANRKYKSISRNDVVLIKTKNYVIIKRVIGLPGETVEYKNNKLYINNNLIDDKYGNGNTEDFSVTLNDDEYYCLGDNRTNSRDSRYYGSFNKDKIFAKITVKE